MHFIRMLCVAAMAAPTLSAAQAVQAPDWPIAAGSRVRIVATGLGVQQLTGNVVSATADTLFFRPASESTSVAIGTPNIVRIEVARGTHRNTAKGALIGLLAGSLVGAAIGVGSYEPCGPGAFGFCGGGRGTNATFFGSYGGLGGTIVGALLGMQQTDTWVQVAVPAR